ncbi:MAG: aminotransferase class I/II-fold pyridoxal phosphate-dependent enzyme [Dysgonamonadaceae bacterium]|nr:aminotransferase class I/II-fold pyridoxal phosphate-dependent enzyme [Dysgonamonadaceae bacterium]
MQNRIHLSVAHLGGREQEYVKEAFDSNWVTTAGHNIDAFEKDLEKFLGNNSHALALYSGTAAIHLALILMDVKDGDEVLCQSFTYSASANPIFYQRATPVFVDSEEKTWNMSPEHLERAIKDRIKKGKKPKAVIPVHLYGMPASMDEILAIAAKYEIPVIEDAAESLGSVYKGINCGTFGDLSILSFNGNKIITTAGGGVLVSGNQELIRKALYLSTQARDATTHYQHSQIGYNYRMSNILAGIGRAQMQVLPQRIEQRRKNNIYYREHLSCIDGISFLTESSPDIFSNYWLTTILVDKAKTGGADWKAIQEKLEEANIESRPLWKPMHLQPVFRDCPFYGDGTSDALFEKGLCLPSGSILSEEDLQRVVEVIRKTVKCDTR